MNLLHHSWERVEAFRITSRGRDRAHGKQRVKQSSRGAGHGWPPLSLRPTSGDWRRTGRSEAMAGEANRGPEMTSYWLIQAIQEIYDLYL